MPKLLSAEERRLRQRARDKRKRAAKPEHYRAMEKAWSSKNPEKLKAHQRKYIQSAKGRAFLVRRRAREKLNPRMRIYKAMRDSVRNALQGAGGQKTLRTMAIVGCSVGALHVHLERQFKRGMTWSNYGKHWHIDHITPVSYFDLSEPAQLALCFNWQNLRPLWRTRNISEGNRRGTSQLHLPLCLS